MTSNTRMSLIGAALVLGLFAVGCILVFGFGVLG